MPKAAVLSHIDPAHDCPLMDEATQQRFRDAVQTSNTFSLACLEFLERRTDDEKAAWLMNSVQAGRTVFQQWNLEILYVLAVVGRGRFTNLLSLLGMSSRTLSDKLKALRDEGLIDRELFDEQPVRIEYFLTKSGRKVAALASPLLAHLGHEAITATRS